MCLLLSRLVFFLPWRWKRHIPPKRQLTFNGLDAVVSQKIEIFITTDVRTSDSKYVIVCSLQLSWIRKQTFSINHSFWVKCKFRIYVTTGTIWRRRGLPVAPSLLRQILRLTACMFIHNCWSLSHSLHLEIYSSVIHPISFGEHHVFYSWVCLTLSKL
jgi:hypothetical protein